MKKLVIMLAVLLALGMAAFAQEENMSSSDAVTGGESGHVFAFGFAPEVNWNSWEGVAMGAALNFDFNFGGVFGLGINVTASYDFFGGLVTLEPAVLFRWYIISENYTGLFLQADVGAYLFLNEEINPTITGGLRLGYCIPLGGSFYIEPYGRAGYPFVYGVGVTMGFRF